MDDAAALVFHALGLDHAQAEAAYAVHPDGDGVARVLALFQERVDRRMPAAYLMGRMWFAGLEFEVDARVIVPRSPFAELIHAGFAPWIDPSAVKRILDIGTGSGCIAIACAVAFPNAHVDAVDLSSHALEVARRNVAKHGVADQLEQKHELEYHVPNRTWYFFCHPRTYNNRMTAGVYAIYNMQNNMVYVGCSSQIEARWERHMHALETNTHSNYRLQKAHTEAKDAFAFIILEVTDPVLKFRRDQVWFDRMMRFHELYNLDLSIPEELDVVEKQQESNK